MLPADSVNQHTAPDVHTSLPRAMTTHVHGPSTAARASVPPDTGASIPSKTTALVATLSRKTSSLFRQPAASVPPPLTVFRHHRSVSVDQLKAFAEYHDPSAPRLIVQESVSAPVAPQFNTRKLVNAFRESIACQCGCMVSDIAWFVITQVNVVGKSAAGTGGVLGGAEDDVALCDREQMLSFSTTFNSGPCLASFIAIFQHLCVEMTFAHRAVELLSGTSPGMRL
jgi:hypothetical protein